MIPLTTNVGIRQRFAYVTLLLIIINAVLFVYEIGQLANNSDQFMQYALTSSGISLLTLVTYQFLHGGWIHLLGNMVYLWVFGNAVEDRLGHIPFLFFYLASGMVGGAIQALILHSDVPLIGASASIAGLLGAFLIWYPNAQIKVLLPIIIYWTVISLPALLVLGLWFVTNLFNGYASVVASEVDNVAYVAHIGGFAFGALIGWLLRRQSPVVA